MQKAGKILIFLKKYFYKKLTFSYLMKISSEMIFCGAKI